LQDFETHGAAPGLYSRWSNRYMRDDREVLVARRAVVIDRSRVQAPHEPGGQ
jgi:hypothetical protein